MFFASFQTFYFLTRVRRSGTEGKQSFYRLALPEPFASLRSFRRVSWEHFQLFCRK
ncbi:MAG: hypothetical protein K0Q59_4318 [Paenibacillus sp.]|nr:hypothetical protein [Paenibacillus sp.]